MGIVCHNIAVFECSGLAFIGIHTQVLGFILTLGYKTPFHACRKSGAPSAPQVSFLDLIEDILRSHFLESFLHRFIAAFLCIDADRVSVFNVEKLT